MHRVRRWNLLSERHRVHPVRPWPRCAPGVPDVCALHRGFDRHSSPRPLRRMRIGKICREWDAVHAVRPRPRRARGLVRMHGLRGGAAYLAHARLLRALSSRDREPLALRHVLLELLRRHVRNGRRRVRRLPRGRVLRSRSRQVRDLRRRQLLGEAEHGVLSMRKGNRVFEGVGKMRYLCRGLVCDHYQVPHVPRRDLFGCTSLDVHRVCRRNRLLRWLGEM